jgi:hypothetical protein
VSFKNSVKSISWRPRRWLKTTVPSCLSLLPVHPQKSECSANRLPRYELRKTADGEYEKKTTKSERHERKTSDEEMLVATGLPSPTVSLTRWHELVPERVKLEVSGVTAEGCPEAPSLDADYILDLLDRRPEKCRWEYTFRAKCQLFRCCLEAYPDSEGKLTLRAFFEGSVAGPAWTQTGLRDLSGRVMLSFDHASAENPRAGCRWPGTVTRDPACHASGYEAVLHPARTDPGRDGSHGGQ